MRLHPAADADETEPQLAVGVLGVLVRQTEGPRPSPRWRPKRPGNYVGTEELGIDTSPEMARMCWMGYNCC